MSSSATAVAFSLAPRGLSSGLSACSRAGTGAAAAVASRGVAQVAPQFAAASPLTGGLTSISQLALAFSAVAAGRRRRALGAAGGSSRSAATSTVVANARGGATGPPTLHVGMVGYGLVGKELVAQLLASSADLEEKLGVRVEICGVARSSTMALLAGADAQQQLADGAWPSTTEDADLSKLAKHLLEQASSSGGRALIVDNTASDTPAELYADWLAAGIDVATPNKRAGAGPYTRYQQIMDSAKRGGSQFLYEATVGAGLPIIAPLQGLVAAGDEVKVVQGIFSGTLSYIFNTWTPGTPFSDVVKEAKDKGFTEPDPRDDLGGTDVQRKVTILARELGLKIELDDVPVESLVPEKLRDWEPPAGKPLGDAYVEELKAYDGEMAKTIEEAEANGQVLRFVGKIDVQAGTGSVELARFPKDHPFAGTQFADNIVTYDTKWYQPRPLVVQGPGAGAAVTAAGVYGNILEVMRGMKKPA
eukprot:TRINITY_DN412_c0_g1_i1.p1 TRINITY_DN412_c0_g1~~TRINITY_DN412_c0_g1_i1.p1  ORF type:complete len:491 (+),score=132.86 TRINITY_DN412_c0_g1_i1:46-1473(+)